MSSSISNRPNMKQGKAGVVRIPLSSPVHEVVGCDQGRHPVENLALAAAEGVENRIVKGAGEGVLAVGRETPVNDALLLLSTW